MDSASIKLNSSTQLVYDIETIEFTLHLSLNNQRLEILENDLVHGVQYSNQYTNKNMEGTMKEEFNDIFDLFQVFIPKDELEKQMLKNGMKVEIETARTTTPAEHIDRNYRLGQKIDNGSAQFSVEDGGKISILCLFEIGLQVKRTRKYSTVLQLNKIRQLANKDLVDYRFKTFRAEMEKRFEMITNLSAERQKNMQKQIAEIKEKLGVIMKENEELKENLRKNDLVFEDSEFRSKFVIQKTTATFINNGWTQLTHSMKIGYSDATKFAIKVINSHSMYIMVGVNDFKQTKNIRSPYQTAHAIAYYGNGEGLVYFNGEVIETGVEGFKMGDTIETEVKLWMGEISWKVNGEVRCAVSHDFLKNKDSEFHPYCELYTTGDSIQWIAQ